MLAVLACCSDKPTQDQHHEIPEADEAGSCVGIMAEAGLPVLGVCRKHMAVFRVPGALGGTLDFLRWRSDSRGKSTAVATEVSVMVEVDVTMVALVWSAQLQGARTVAPSFQGA
jgi:hypothetical protein